MELPKNVTQVGNLNKMTKVYIEDYVISYLKQMNAVADNKRLGVALYGKKNTEDVSYYFIYGACKLDYLNRESRRLSSTQLQEMESVRQAHFAELESVGYAILTGESIEGIYLLEREGSHYVGGYSCFYEKNDSMLSFMLENRGTKYQPETVAQEKYIEVKTRQEDRRRLYEENASRTKSNFPVLQTICAAMFMVLCLSAVFYTRLESGQSPVPEGVSNYLAKILGESQTPLPQENETASTLVAGQELAQEIQKENEMQEQLMEASASAVETAVPEVVATEEPLPQPIPEVTAQPTPLPTPEPTPIPVVEYVICPGDTLISICKSHYGDEGFVRKVCEANDIANPDNICIGQKIVLP